MYANRRNFHTFKVIWVNLVKEHNGDVQFLTGRGNTAVSRMRNE